MKDVKTYVNVVFLHVYTDFLHTVPNVGTDDLVVVLKLSLRVDVVVDSSYLTNKGRLTGGSNTLRPVRTVNVSVAKL